jgi:hypothetical protein
MKIGRPESITRDREMLAGPVSRSRNCTVSPSIRDGRAHDDISGVVTCEPKT